MPDLPTGQREFYCGIDPGFNGAIGLMNAAGTTVKVWDLPTHRTGPSDIKEFNLTGFDRIFRELAFYPGVTVGLEWPTTRPGEGSERSERFGRGKGYLEAFLWCKGIKYHKIAPNLWKGRLGLPGKSDPDANKIAAKLFDTYYPDHTDLIRGSLGGIRDGRCDALLIAHFLRARTLDGMRTVVEKFGKGSPEAMAMLFKGRRRHKTNG